MDLASHARLRRPIWHRRFAICAAAVSLLALLVGMAHTPYVRARALSWAISRLQADTGLRVAAGELRYNLLALSADLHAVEVVAQGADTAFLHVDEIRLNLPWSILRGHLSVQSLEIIRPRLTVVRQPDRSFNLPAGAQGQSASGPIGPIKIGRLVVRDLAVRYRDESARLSVDGLGVTLDLAAQAGALLAGRVSMSDGVTIRVGDRQTAVADLRGKLAFDGTALAIDELSLRAPEAQIRVDGRVSLLSDEPRADMRYAGSVDLGRLAPWLPTVPALRGVIAFSGRLEGPLDHPDVTIDVGGDRLGWSTLRDLSLEIRAALSDTIVTVESFRAGLGGGELTGEARLSLGPTGPGRARLRWRGLDVGVLVGASASNLDVRLASVADGAAALDWIGQDVLTARGSIESRLRASTSSRGSLAVEGRALLKLGDGSWSLSLDELVGNAIVLSGQAAGRFDANDLAASTVEGTVSAQVAHLDEALQRLAAAGLTPHLEALQPLRGRVDATAAFTGTLRSPSVTSTLQASDLRYREIGPGAARASFEATTGLVALDSVRVDLGPNVVEAHALINVAANRLSGDLTANLPEAALLAATVPAEWRPEGSIRVHAGVTGAIDDPTVATSVSAGDLRIAGQQIRSLRASARLERRVVAVDAFELSQDEGRFSATGRYAIASGRYAFDATGADLVIAPIIRGAPVHALSTPGVPGAGAIPVEARFDLRFTGEGTLASPEARGFLQCSRLAWNHYELGTARLEAIVEQGTVSLNASLPELPATLETVVRLEAPHAFTMQASLLNAQLQPLVGWRGPGGTRTPPLEPFPAPGVIAGAVTAHASAAGRLDEISATNASLDLSLTDVAVNGAPIRLERPARLRYSAGQLIAEAFDLRIGNTTVSATGRLGAPRGGNGSLPTGASDSLRATLKGSLADLLPIARLVPGLRKVDASGAVDVQVRVAGAIDAPEIDGEFALDSAAFTSGALPPVHDVALRVSYARGLLDVRDVRAEWQGATLTASGQLPAELLGDRLPESYRKALPDLPGRAHATGRIASLTQAALSPFLHQETISEISGRFDVVAAIETSSLTLDDLVADITVERGEVELARVPISQARPSRLRLADGRIDIVEWTWAGAGNRISVAGNAVLSGKAPALDLAVTGAVDLRMLGAFSRNIATAGLAALDVKVSGRANEPVIGGQMSIQNGQIIVRDPRVAVTDIQGIIDLAGDRLTLRDITANANGGTVRIAGDVQYQGFQVAGGTISITGRELAFDVPDGLRTEIGMDLQLALAKTAPSLTGSVTILRGSYRQPISLASQLLGGVEVSSVSPAEGTEPVFVDRLSLGISVVSAQDIVVDNNYGRLEIASNLTIAGTLGQPALAGRLMLQEGGDVFLGGRTYVVQRGTVDFTSATHIEPTIDLSLETRIQRYDITMEVSGTPDTIQVNLRSPGLSEVDVTSLLLTGQLASSANVAQTEIARGQLLMLLSGELLGFAGRAVGLDTVQIGQGLGGAASDFDLLATDTDPSARLTIGKNVGRDVEIVFSQNLRESGSITWIAIYRPLPKLELRATSQDDGSRSYEFRHDLEFGGGDAERPRAADLERQRAERVVAVRIAGSPRFGERELRGLLRLEVGDQFDFYRWQQDRERLERFYHERDFREVRISAQRKEATGPDAALGVTLEYVIERGPRTGLVVDGYTLPDVLIENMQKTWEEAVFDGFLLEDLETMARRQLLEDGFLQVEVKGEVASQPDGATKQIALHIAPGIRFDERRMSFVGQQHLSADTLDALVRARGLEVTAWLHPDELKAAIESRYRALGYLAATVTVDPPVFSGRSAVLPVRVTEGPAFQIASVDVLGTSMKSEADVRHVFGIAAGSPYLPSLLEPARRAVEVDYLRDGYNDARVSVSARVDSEHARVRVALNVDEGRQQVLSRVDVTGAEVTAESVVDRALDLEPGKPANLSDVYRAQKRLYDTGVFRSADIEIEPVEGTLGPVEPVRVVVKLQELPSYRFRYGFRISDRVGPAEAGREIRPALVGDLLRRNLFGRAVSTGVAGQIEADRRLARGVVSLPRFLGLPVTTNLFVTRSRETVGPKDAQYVDDVSEITAEQRFRPAEHMAVTYGYSLSHSHEFDLNPNPFLPPLNILGNVARFTSAYAWDTRDDPSNARAGWFQSSGLELGVPRLGSDQRFIRYLAQQYYFKTVRSRIVLASAFRLGAGRDFDEEALQPSDRFYAGGGTSVRGFAEGGLGRIVLGYPTGGNSMLLLNQELRFPIFKWFGGVGFIDAGNVFPLARDLSITALEAGAGFGLRIDSPFALFRIDYGMPLTRRALEPFGRWYFGIGQTF